MNILHVLTEKPWLTPGLATWTEAGGDDNRRTDTGVGLGVFLGVVTILFSLVSAAYLMRMGEHVLMGHGGGDWTRLREPPLLWINTGLLALSSVAWQGARRAARADDISRVRTALLVAGPLGIAFLIGQLAVWRALESSGYWLAARSALCTVVPDPLAQPIDHFVTGNPAIAFFYLITGLHGLHILGGLVAWARTSTRVMRGASVAEVQRPIALNARYWHFLLFVWLVMFGLMLLT